MTRVTVHVTLAMLLVRSNVAAMPENEVFMNLRIFVATESGWHGLIRFPHLIQAAGADVVLMCRRDAVIASTAQRATSLRHWQVVARRRHPAGR